MRKEIIISLVVLVLLACSTAKQSTSASPNWKKVSVLVYTKNGKGYVHQNIAAASAAIQSLGGQYGFTVKVSDNPAEFTEANLKNYQLLIFNNTNNDVFDNDDQRVAFMRYIQAGGGFVGLHSATGTERNWPWFKRLIGATFQRHAKHQPFTEIIIDSKHPSTASLPHTWKRDDECYYVKEVNPDLRVLVVHDLASVSDTGKPVFYGPTFPSVWCHEFDGGREWYTSLGHDSATYSEPAFQQHILGGIQWVVGNNKPLDYSKAYAKTPSDTLPY
jgi:type 1 glutamine amidotransferase